MKNRKVKWNKMSSGNKLNDYEMLFNHCYSYEQFCMFN